VELSILQRGDVSLRSAAAERPASGRNAAIAGMTRKQPGEHSTCGNAACRSAWTLPWKSRRYPVFEEKWACSGKCLLAMVKASIAREVGDGRRDSVEIQHQHRIPLGLLMLSQGWITHPQLQRALEAQRAEGAGRIGRWLIAECGLDAEVVTRGLSVQWGCPVLTTEGFSPTAMAMALPRVFIENFGILPLRVAGSRILYVGFEDHLDASSAFAVEQMNGLRTESGVVAEDSFREARERLLACQFAPLTECRVPDGDTLAKAIATVIDQKSAVASRLVRLRKYYWLRVWTAKAGYAHTGSIPAKAQDAGDYLFTIGKSA
jgi:hypothetical protein